MTFATPAVSAQAAPPTTAESSILRHAACEFGLSGRLLFFVVTGVRWLIAPDSPTPAHDVHYALAILGITIGVSHGTHDVPTRPTVGRTPQPRRHHRAVAARRLPIPRRRPVRHSPAGRFRRGKGARPTCLGTGSLPRPRRLRDRPRRPGMGRHRDPHGRDRSPRPADHDVLRAPGAPRRPQTASLRGGACHRGRRRDVRSPQRRIGRHDSSVRRSWPRTPPACGSTYSLRCSARCWEQPSWLWPSPDHTTAPVLTAREIIHQPSRRTGTPAHAGVQISPSRGGRGRCISSGPALASSMLTRRGAGGRRATSALRAPPPHPPDRTTSSGTPSRSWSSSAKRVR